MKNNFMHLFRRHLLISRNKESSGMSSAWSCKLTIFTITLVVFRKKCTRFNVYVFVGYIIFDN